MMILAIRILSRFGCGRKWTNARWRCTRCNTESRRAMNKVCQCFVRHFCLVQTGVFTSGIQELLTQGVPQAWWIKLYTDLFNRYHQTHHQLFCGNVFVQSKVKILTWRQRGWHLLKIASMWEFKKDTTNIWKNLHAQSWFTSCSALKSREAYTFLPVPQISWVKYVVCEGFVFGLA